MDLLSLVLDPEKIKSVCFLCLKHSDKVTGLNQSFIIHSETETIEIMLFDIFTYLFPSHEILTEKACKDCANLLLKMYTIIHRNKIKIVTLTKLLETMSNEIYNEVNNSCNNNRIYININKSTPSGDIVIKTDSENFSMDNNDTEHVNKYSCKQCSMQFPTIKFLQKHMKLSHKVTNKSVVCEFCGKDCKTSASLQAHLNSHKYQKCPYCSKSLKSNCHYKIHLKNHESKTKRERRRNYYFCNVCSYKSFNKKSLEGHTNKVHLKIRPYICDICNRGFYNKSNLTEHVLIHTTTKDLTCEQCGNSFYNKKTLYEHARLHTGEKPYECEICNERFVTSGRRTDHFKRRHMEKLFSCYACEKKFGLKKDLNMHLKKIHSENRDQL